jgi:Sulfotransferase domain
MSRTMRFTQSAVVQPKKAGRLEEFVSKRLHRVRRFHAYCIGTSKSGTHSVANLFHRHYRVAHEPGYERLIDMILDASSGLASQNQIAGFVRSRDNLMRLELECSHPLLHVLDVLLGEFNEAKFILTIRDCYSWLDSQINSQLSYIEGKHWKDFGDFKYSGETGRHPKDEQLLARFGLYTLEGYLKAWVYHNDKALTTVPEDKLLVVRTQDIAKDVPKLAAFLEVPLNHLDIAGVHSFKGARKFDLLSRLDAGYLENKVNELCRPLMDRHFPELESLAAWLAVRRETQKISFG